MIKKKKPGLIGSFIFSGCHEVGEVFGSKMKGEYVHKGIKQHTADGQLA